MHTFDIYCSFADKPSIQTWLWLLMLLRVSCCRKSLLKFSFFYAGQQEMEVHVIQRRNECRIQWRRQQSILTSQKCAFLLQNGQLYILFMDVYLGACALYTQICIQALSVPTDECICHQIWVKVEISLRTLIPLFRPGSVHSGSASLDDCGWVIPYMLWVSSFPVTYVRPPHYDCTAA